MGKTSRDKGKRGELELAHRLQEYGYEARRGQQYAGINGDADVVGVPGLHIECKRVETLNVEKALVQSEQDCGKHEIPVVMHRKNREEWKVTMRLDDFMEIWKGVTRYDTGRADDPDRRHDDDWDPGRAEEDL